MKATKLFHTGTIAGLETKNRIVMPAMSAPLASLDHEVTQKTIDYYVERAKGGVGLIIVGYTAPSSDSTIPCFMSMHDDKFIPGFRQLVKAVHEHGTRIALQLCHLGMVLAHLPLPNKPDVLAPSILPWLKEDGSLKEAAKSDIERCVEHFSEAARRARDAGFDAVEFHACHGALLSAFLSPMLNRRSDEYGGSAENRVRIIRQIISRTREKVGPKFPLILRINGDDDCEGGVTMEDAIRHSVLLEQAGVDAISLSVGLEYWSPLSFPCYLYQGAERPLLAAAVKRAIKIPVVASGKIDALLGEQVLVEGHADFIALGRPLLADPHLPNKAREGRLNDINRCIYCNNCLTFGRNGYQGCTVNPFLYRESEYPPTPATSRKKVMVVGGGLAGMQAAVILAERGHEVSLYERDSDLGGQWKVASAMKNKLYYASLIDQLAKRVSKSGAKVFLNTEVTREFALRQEPDAVILATGAVPLTLDVAGTERVNVVQANDVIAGRAKVGNTVVIVGGRVLGMEMAVDLSEQGKEVTLVEKDPTIPGTTGRAIESQTCKALLRRLIQLRVPLYSNSLAIEIARNGILIKNSEGVFLLEADTVVLAIGTKSENKLASTLKEVIPVVYQIGDCVGPEDARTATYEAATVAAKI